MPLGLAFAAMNAMALQELIGKVVAVEPTYLPGRVQFTLDSGTASCPAGGWLAWQNADPGNNKAVYATLLAALATGKSVRAYFDPADATCTAQFVHLLNQ